MVFTFLENALNLSIFTHAPVPHSKLHVRFNYISFLKSENSYLNEGLLFIGRFKTGSLSRVIKKVSLIYKPS